MAGHQHSHNLMVHRQVPGAHHCHHCQLLQLHLASLLGQLLQFHLASLLRQLLQLQLASLLKLLQFQLASLLEMLQAVLVGLLTPKLDPSHLPKKPRLLHQKSHTLLQLSSLHHPSSLFRGASRLSLHLPGLQLV